MSDQISFDEEPWEAEIAGLLGQLPSVEPPPGFMAKAVDHRPMFAGRTIVGFGLVAAALVIGATALGGFDRQHVVPELDSLAARHSAALVEGEALLDEGQTRKPPVSLPGSYEDRGSREEDDVSQSVYANQGDAISVFSQDGQVDWSRLPAEGIDDVHGNKAWVDPDRGVLVFESGDSAVTIVGLTSTDLSELLDRLPRSSGGWLTRFSEAANSLSAELGFDTP